MIGWLASRFGVKGIFKYGAIALAVAGIGIGFWQYGDLIEERILAREQAKEWKSAYESGKERHEDELRAVTLATDQRRLINQQESEIRNEISSSEDGALAPVLRGALERMRRIERGQDQDGAK